MKTPGFLAILVLFVFVIFVALDRRWPSGCEPAQSILEKEFQMSAAMSETEKVGYNSPRRVLVAFFARSRDKWKQKYMHQKTEMKRLKNRVADVTKSREKWRDDADVFRRRAEELQVQNAVLQEQLAALKKGGLGLAAR